MKFEPYDPTWLAQLAAEQVPELPWLASAFAECAKASKKWAGRRKKKKCIYIYFVDNKDANQPGAEWQHKGVGISLNHPLFGRILVDTLEGARIGSIEFLDRLL